jgi:hypothetical protein
MNPRLSVRCCHFTLRCCHLLSAVVTKSSLISSIFAQKVCITQHPYVSLCTILTKYKQTNKSRTWENPPARNADPGAVNSFSQVWLLTKRLCGVFLWTRNTGRPQAFITILVRIGSTFQSSLGYLHIPVYTCLQFTCYAMSHLMLGPKI